MINKMFAFCIFTVLYRKKAIMDVQQMTDARSFRWDQSRCSKGKEQLHITTKSIDKQTCPCLWQPPLHWITLYVQYY